MKNNRKYFFIFLIILAFLPKSFCLANVFNQDNTMVKNPSDIPDPLAQYEIKDQANGILNKITGEWQKINNWGIGFYSKKIEPYFGKYIDRVVQNAKQGWEEEKQEYKQDFFKTIGIAWEKIKNKLFHK